MTLYLRSRKIEVLYMRSRRKRKSATKKKTDRGNKLALIGITSVVLSLAVVVNLGSANLIQKNEVYKEKEASITKQIEKEKVRSEQLAERKIYVQTKQYIEKIAEDKLGLVKPTDILIKANKDD